MRGTGYILLNYVVGYNEFFRFPACLLLKLAQVIPKKNFTPDLYCMRQMRSIIHQGGHLCIMPEGMSSITGMAQPVMAGTGKFLKMMGVTVYYTKISGGYLTYTKHCLDERVGRVGGNGRPDVHPSGAEAPASPGDRGRHEPSVGPR